MCSFVEIYVSFLFVVCVCVCVSVCLCVCVCFQSCFVLFLLLCRLYVLSVLI